jgi:signal transduction histidine kinase
MTPPSMAAERPSSCAARLRQEREVIEDKWLQRVRREVPSAQDQPEPALRDNIPKIIEALAAALEHTNDSSFDKELFWRHAETRLDWSTYSAEELIREYGLLRKVLFSVLEEKAPLSAEERDKILDFIEAGIQVGSARFEEVQRLNDRLELQYLKLIEHLVAESGDVGESEARLERLLEVIQTDLGAEAAAFVLYHEDTLNVTLSSAAAKSKGLAEMYRAALSLSSAGALRPDEGEAVQMVAVAGLDALARAPLDELGIRWLVIVRVVSRGHVPGTLCLGFQDKRALDSREVHLLEVLGDRLALLLASLQLREQSHAALERVRLQTDMLEAERSRLDEERRRRDQLIAAISHDLKNPLSTARMGADLIRRGTGTPAATERLADQILKSISRSDQMVHDLLDSQQIRAGKRLTLDMVWYEMNDLLDAVVKEMSQLHGDRFVVIAQPNVGGFWSWEGCGEPWKTC